MKYYFPPRNQNYTFLQTNRSDDLGSIWSSFNLDFQTNLGVIRLSQKLVTNTTSSDDADLGVPCAFEYFDTVWWAICGTRVFKNTGQNLTLGFTEDASTGAQTDYEQNYSDLCLFDNRLWSTTTDNLYSKAADGSGTGTWTSRDALSGSTIHKMAYLKKFNRLYYTDTSTAISSINTANAVANSTGDYFIELGNSNSTITTIAATSTDIFIGMGVNSSSSAAYNSQCTILQWDGISAQVTNEYKVNAGAIMALTVYESIVYAFDSEGRILKFTGYSFEEIARLPVNRILMFGATFNADPTKFVHFNGFTSTKNNTLLVNVNNLNWDTNLDVTENLPSGIWECDLGTGNFTHRYSFTLKSLASSTITDYGQNRIGGVGAIKNTYLSLNSTRTGGRSVLFAGANYYTNATDSKFAIFIDSPAQPSSDTEGQKRGYYVTTWFNSTEVEDKFERLWDIHKRFLTSTDKIVYKYRLYEQDPTLATITWTSTTTFTTTTDVSAYAPTISPFNGTTGGEVEVLQGTGSGSCTHITSIVNNGGTYTVTLDTAVTGVTGTAKARFQKWIKLFPDVTGLVKSYEQMAIGGNNVQIQVKCCMEFTGDMEFHRMAIFSNEDIKITA